MHKNTSDFFSYIYKKNVCHNTSYIFQPTGGAKVASVVCTVVQQTLQVQLKDKCSVWRPLLFIVTRRVLCATRQHVTFHSIEECFSCNSRRMMLFNSFNVSNDVNWSVASITPKSKAQDVKSGVLDDHSSAKDRLVTWSPENIDHSKCCTLHKF